MPRFRRKNSLCLKYNWGYVIIREVTQIITSSLGKLLESRSTVVGWGSMLQAGRSWIRVPTRSLHFYIYNINIYINKYKWVPGMFLRIKVRSARKADNLTVICEPIVYKLRERWSLTTLWVFTACYQDGFNFYLILRYTGCLKMLYNGIPNVASVTKTFTLNDTQMIHRPTPRTIG
jgi:hypothetical protein